MEVLSTADGSAQAVRDAASASDGAEGGLALERELDRVNAAIGAHATAAAQHLQWTLLAQALLLASYLIVLIGGWSLALPGKRGLLAAIAGYGAATLVLGHLSHRGSRDRVAPLRHGRRRVEQALERIAMRPVVFSRDGVISRSAGDWATALLPVALLTGWIALCVYTLALPLPTDARSTADARAAAAADARAAPRSGTASVTVAPAPRSKGTNRKGDEIAQSAAPAQFPAQLPTQAPAEETGLAALFRRAINAPAPTEAVDVVKP